MKRSVILYNLKTGGMVNFESSKLASLHLKRHPSTLSRALSGDRNKLTVNGHLVFHC